MKRRERCDRRFAASIPQTAVRLRTTHKLEKLLSVKQARELFLGSYSKAEIYRMLECGQIRGLWERRGTRRHWSIPVSAIAEFIERLKDNSDPSR